MPMTREEELAANLRDFFRQKEEAELKIRTLDSLIRVQGTEYWRLQGMVGMPRIERLKQAVTV